MWYRSIKFQVMAALSLQFVALLSIVLTTLYLVNLRQHDYVILNLTGQLRVLNEGIVTQARHYAEQAPRSYRSYYRDLGLFNKDLQMQVQAFDRIIRALKARSIDADLINHRALTPATVGIPEVPSLTAKAEPIICNWNAPARNQMDATALVWDRFYAGLKKELGHDADGPRLEGAARYVLKEATVLTDSTADLANTFRDMMEYKLTQIKMLNRAAIGILAGISLTIIFILYQRIFRPIDQTVSGFRRVARGDLAHQVPVLDSNEIGAMTATFNDLTRRLWALFRLADRINQSDNLDDTLRFVFEDFPIFFPVQWVALLRTSRNAREYHIDRRHGDTRIDVSEDEHFDTGNSIFMRAIDDRKPFCNCISATDDQSWINDPFMQRLQQNQLRSVFYLPISHDALETAVLVLATEAENAYNADHLEFMTNIADQVGHSFEKTIGMESLVISSIKGLAMLAESRDPETGNHLLRMSHYSALVAEELGRHDKYKSVIDNHYVRDILRFAPMHDIGKVGIADDILLKPGKLDADQHRIMQQHPVIGGKVLRQCELQMNAVGRSVFQIGIEIAECHHEKFDGSGYPNQLQGEQIPLSARIVAVADVFDALTSKRPYKEAWPVDKAMEQLRQESGKHFDPEMVAAFERALPRVMDIYNKHKHV